MNSRAVSACCCNPTDTTDQASTAASLRYILFSSVTSCADHKRSATANPRGQSLRSRIGALMFSAHSAASPPRILACCFVSGTTGILPSGIAVSLLPVVG
ncbi:hypothetical protein D3C71_1648600 [compost metagenome]